MEWNAILWYYNSLGSTNTRYRKESDLIINFYINRSVKMTLKYRSNLRTNRCGHILHRSSDLRTPRARIASIKMMCSTKQMELQWSAKTNCVFFLRSALLLVLLHPPVRILKAKILIKKRINHFVLKFLDPPFEAIAAQRSAAQRCSNLAIGLGSATGLTRFLYCQYLLFYALAVFVIVVFLFFLYFYWCWWMWGFLLHKIKINAFMMASQEALPRDELFYAFAGWPNG